MHIVEGNITSSRTSGVTRLDLPRLNARAALNQDNREAVLSEICHAEQSNLVAKTHICPATHCEATLSSEIKVDWNYSQGAY